MISTTSPLCSSVRSGMCRPLILAPDGLRAEVGVHREGEIDRGRALGQLEQRALGGEGEDAVLVDRQARVLEQFLGVVAGVDDLDQVAQPADLAVGPVALLVGPVRGEAELVAAVHLAGADLHFDALRCSRRSAWCEASGSRSILGVEM